LGDKEKKRLEKQEESFQPVASGVIIWSCYGVVILMTLFWAGTQEQIWWLTVNQLL